jgi:uncharacterized membrane protein YjjP (DUF1212 family)
MSTQAELAAELVVLKDQVVKSRNEVIRIIADLTAALAAAGGTTEEVNAAMAELRRELQISDDIVPDPLP